MQFLIVIGQFAYCLRLTDLHFVWHIHTKVCAIGFKRLFVTSWGIRLIRSRTRLRTGRFREGIFSGIIPTKAKLRRVEYASEAGCGNLLIFFPLTKLNAGGRYSDNRFRVSPGGHAQVYNTPKIASDDLEISQSCKGRGETSRTPQEEHSSKRSVFPKLI